MANRFGKMLLKEKNNALQYLEIPKEDIRLVFAGTDIFDKGGLNAQSLEQHMSQVVAIPDTNFLLFEFILLIMRIGENYEFKDLKIFEKTPTFAQKLNYIFDRLEYAYGTLQTEYSNEVQSMVKIEKYEPKYLLPQEENSNNDEDAEGLNSAKINTDFNK